MNAPADPGLQAERTSLSWRRTALSVAVGSLVGLRLFPTELGVVGYVVCALGLAWSLDLATAGRLRHRQADTTLRHPGSTLSAPGGFIVRTAVGAAVTGLVALGYVIASTEFPRNPMVAGPKVAPALSVSEGRGRLALTATHVKYAPLAVSPLRPTPSRVTGQARAARAIND